MAECLTFVSQKINKVRWKPVATSLQKSDFFACGSYEDTRNTVSLWGVGHMSKSTNQHLDNYLEDIRNSQPRKACEYLTKGDVAGMEFVDQGNIVIGTSCGVVTLLTVAHASENMARQQTWEGMHNSGRITDVGSSIPDVVSVGEDGSIFVMRIGSTHPVRSFVNVDSSPITCAHFATSNELCTTNMAGQLRIYDVRAPSDAPSRIMVSSENLVALCTVDHHPTQGHILATGGADGCVVIFDTRRECTPVTKLQVHKEDVWEVHFHNDSPEHLFTCSQDGSVRRLDTSFDAKTLTSDATGSSPVEVSELLPQSLMSANSIDASGRLLLCSSDAEAVYIVDNAV